MFTQPCFIRKNTPELRNKLEELGYKCNNGKWMGAYLATFKRDNDNDLFYCGTPEYDLKNNPSLNYSIDCGTSEQLFLALASLQDDTDADQWFVYPKENHWFKCYDNNIEEIRNEPSTRMSCQAAWFYESHKATVEELIEHFKDK